MLYAYGRRPQKILTVKHSKHTVLSRPRRYLLGTGNRSRIMCSSPSISPKAIACIPHAGSATKVPGAPTLVHLYHEQKQERTVHALRQKIPSSNKPRARRRSSLCKPPRRVSVDVPAAPPIPTTVFTAAAAASSNPNISTAITAATMSSSDSMDFDHPPPPAIDRSQLGPPPERSDGLPSYAPDPRPRPARSASSRSSFARTSSNGSGAELQPPRRRSSMDNPDEITEQLLSAPPPPRQRRRSTVDATTSGARPLFRPPNGSLQEPLDAEDQHQHRTRRASQSSSEHPLPREQAPPTPTTAATAGLSKRNSMSNLEQAERRASIKQIMCDGRLSQLEKRRSIQYLMDGRRSTIDCGQSNPYLQAKAEAEAKLRSSSFGNGDNDNANGGEGGGEGDSVSVTASTMGESMAESLSRRGSLASVPRRATMDSMDVQMMDLGAVMARPFAGGPASAAVNNASGAPWAGGNRFGGSFGDTNNNSNDNNTNGNDSPMIEVPNHSAEAAAAIAHASLQTHSDHLASKHPYNATTTAVPAVAANASDAYPFHGATNKAKRRNSTDISRRAIETAPPCTHYERNLHIVSPCCGATFGCRICHDDCPVLPPSLNQLNMMGSHGGGELQMDVGMDTGGFGEGGGRKFQRVLRTSSMPTNFSSSIGPPEHHNVDRFAIKEVICRECFTKQSSKTNFCVNCNVRFGEYHCAICNLWMSDEERPYHCPDCGFCRVGGGENFRHCMDCGMCIDKQLFADHNCKVGKYMSNCPVCQEDLFSSRDASHELPCGHAIHWHCFRELASHDSRCPMCKKTAETHERMKPTWDAMAMGIALQPVPPELCKVVTIKCNDCEDIQHDRSWHFLGVQCRKCESFNTVVERITLMGQEAHEFLLRTDPPQGGVPQGGFPSGNGGGSSQQQGGNANGTSSRPNRPRRRRATVAVEPTSGSFVHQPPPPPQPPFEGAEGGGS